jgi:energy-coupling factor transporter ATP-binding protein EcfA2
MPESIIDEPTVALDRYDGNIFVITMRKAPENRLNSEYAQKLIGIFGEIRRILGTSTEGAVITRGNDAKFWCTVGLFEFSLSFHEIARSGRTTPTTHAPQHS